MGTPTLIRKSVGSYTDDEIVLLHLDSSKQIFANDNIVAINMDGLKTTDYIGICRLCLCKGNQANQICATQDNVDTVRLVYDCTSILVRKRIEDL